MLLFGGAAGSLKSETLLVDAALERDRAKFRGVLFRRSYPELDKSLIRRSRELYPSWGANYNETRRRWTFPSGATVEFAYCESEKDIYRYQGAEFSFIGFDESTHFGEFPLRYLLSRLRSTDSGLRLRVRLATNPGNIGHLTHKAIFHGPTCGHCDPAVARQPFQIYSDAEWPSDRRPIGKTTCFIPGRISDHGLLAGDYAANLESLPGAIRKALLDGCWNVYEGQYFDNWHPARMLVKRASVGEQSWWPHWVGVDYGFNVSQAAAYLCAKDTAGVTYVLEELTARHQTATEFGRALHERWNHHHIAAWYLSPDAWAQRGDGHTLGDQMAQAAGVGFTPASHDRVGGAMLLYTLLDRGELKIADGCRGLIEALPSRIHDAGRPDDVAKVAGDPLDDCYDALRYAVYSYAPTARPGAEMQLAAAVTSGDPTIAALQRRLAEERLQRAQIAQRWMQRPRGR
ncbi:MAG: terminase large subunit domain-containing protein [Terriglobales bacterium]